MKRFPLTTLIQLYELLKNSRLAPGNPGDNNKEASCEAALVLLSDVWWRMTGSNRRPPACKAGALPAELIPQGTACVGRAGWTRTNDPRVINTVL